MNYYDIMIAQVTVSLYIEFSPIQLFPAVFEPIMSKLCRTMYFYRRWNLSPNSQ